MSWGRRKQTKNPHDVLKGDNLIILCHEWQISSEIVQQNNSKMLSAMSGIR